VGALGRLLARVLRALDAAGRERPLRAGAFVTIAGNGNTSPIDHRAILL
jgi:hypothetical protein